MATSSFTNPGQPGSRRSRTRLRRSLAAIACTTSLATIAQVTPAIAQPAPSAVAELTDVLSSANPSIAQLAGALADVQSQVTALEADIGSFRERVNQALVDLSDARTEAEQARRGTAAARAELDGAQADVDAAQDKLDELARAQYRRSTHSDTVSNAAGGDSRQDMLDRQSFLRTQVNDQEKVVEDLERVRTTKANKESQLRLAEQLADRREDEAADAEAQAREVLAESQRSIESKVAERDRLVAQQQQAQSLLDARRGIPAPNTAASASDAPGAPTADSTTPGAPTADSTTPGASTADSAVSVSPATPPSSAPTAAEPQSAASAAADSTDPSAQTDSSAFESAPASTTDTTVTADSASAADPAPTNPATEPSAQAPAADSAAPTTDGEQSSASSGSSDLTALAKDLIDAAAQAVAASEPDHTALDEDPTSTDTTNSDALPALQGPVTPETDPDRDLTDQLGDVLEQLDSSDSVTQRAGETVADASRDARIEAVIARAESQIGTPYVWGGGNANGPTQGIRDGGIADSFGDFNQVGFDCSGLTLYAFAGVGISLPHYTGYQYQRGTKVDPSQMQRGDLIFYGPDGGQHVAIYLGDGMMIEAPQSGQTVTKSPVRWSGMAPQVVRLL